jgi:TatD DNase family protein
MRYFDAHSHIHGKEFDADRDEVLARMRAAGVSTITVGTYLESSRQAVALAESEPDVWATVGLHPTDTDESFDEKEFRELAEHKKVVGIGECGSDYFWEKDEQKRKIQRENFARQVGLSLAVDKPLMIHGRPSKGSMDAYEDLLNVISDFRFPVSKSPGNVHFFVGNKEIAKRFLDMGFTMSFTGVITFARDYDEIIRYFPIESILSETDCPYVSPVPYRGKRNEPAYVTEVVKAISGIKKLPAEVVAESLFTNTRRVFGLN